MDAAAINLWMLGATGAVGRAVLDRLPPEARVVAIGRRAPPDQARAHLTGFAPGFEDALPGGPVDALICTLGSNYVTASPAEFWRIDFEVPLAVARAARARGARQMVLVSTLGAHRRAPMLFARAKGALEEALRGLGFEALDVLRPGFIEDSTVPRTRVERWALNASVRLARRSRWFAGSRLGPTRCEAVARDVVAAISRPSGG